MEGWRKWECGEVLGGDDLGHQTALTFGDIIKNTLLGITEKS